MLNETNNNESPQAILAEQSILGALIINNDRLDDIEGRISMHDFNSQQHRTIYQTIVEMIACNEVCDVVTLSEKLKQNNKLAEIGGENYVGDLANNTPASANIKAYCELLRDRSILRHLKTGCLSIIDECHNTEGKDAHKILEYAEKEIMAIAEQQSIPGNKDFKDINSLLIANFQKIEELQRNKKEFTGLETRFIDLDKLTLGLQPADLIIIAGRPSMGKTTFAMNIAENVAIGNPHKEEEKKSVVVFSMEMPAEALSLRMLSSLGMVDQGQIRSGKINGENMNALTSAMHLLNNSKIHIDDTPALSPARMTAKLRRFKRKNNIDLIVIDYLQLMQAQSLGKNPENRTNEISEISRSLKAIAKEFNVPVIALSQLNRSLESRSDKRPVMSDLRESGAIEQDADLIMFIYRDEVYNKESPNNKGLAEIIIGKHRNGPLGTVNMVFSGQHTRFNNKSHDDY